MQLTDSAATGDLLAEITRLENQICKLSSQLDSTHETINLLKKTLAERDSRLYELEANLVITPKFLLQNALYKIHHCRIQIKDEIDEKIINPVLAQIRQQIEFIQRLLDQAKDFINQAKQVIHQNINTTLAVVNQSPEQARFYLEKNIMEPILSLVHQFIETSNRHIKATQSFIGEKIISPSKSFYDQSIEAVLALPSQSQIIFQVHILEPALRALDSLFDFGHRLTDDSLIELKNILTRLKNLIDLGVATITEHVKKSQFWDGKRNIDAIA